jgi:hypothetical protein
LNKRRELGVDRITQARGKAKEAGEPITSIAKSSGITAEGAVAALTVINVISVAVLVVLGAPSPVRDDSLGIGSWKVAVTGLEMGEGCGLNSLEGRA